MNMFNTGINLYESFLFSYFFFSVSDRSNLRKGIACGIYWMLTFSLMQYVEKFSITFGLFQLIIDGAGFICLLAASRNRVSKCLILATLPDLLVAVFNTTLTVLMSIILFHEVDGPKLISTYPVKMILLTKVIETIMFAAISRLLNSKTEIQLNRLEEYLIGSMLVLCVAITDSIETLLFYQSYDPSSIAITILCIGALSLLVIIVLAHFNKRNTQLQEQQKENMLISSQLLSAKETVRAQANLFSLRHDLSHMISLLQNQYADDEYINELSKKLKETDIPVSTSSPAINLILNAERQKATQNNIKVSYVLNIPEPPFASDDDLYILLVNLMDNAINHIGAERKIKLAIISDHDRLIIKAENSSDSEPANNAQEAGTHGFGLPAIRSIAAKYNGTCSFQKEDGEFISFVILHRNKYPKQSMT